MNERNEQIIRLRDEGATWGELSKQFGLTREGVRQVYLRAVGETASPLCVPDGYALVKQLWRNVGRKHWKSPEGLHRFIDQYPELPRVTLRTASGATYTAYAIDAVVEALERPRDRGIPEGWSTVDEIAEATGRHRRVVVQILTERHGLESILAGRRHSKCYRTDAALKVLSETRRWVFRSGSPELQQALRMLDDGVPIASIADRFGIQPQSAATRLYAVRRANRMNAEQVAA